MQTPEARHQLQTPRPLFHDILHEAYSLATAPSQLLPGPPSPSPLSPPAPAAATPGADVGSRYDAAAAARQDTACMQAMGARMHAQCSRLLGLPDVAAANCGRPPQRIRIEQLLPRLLADAAAAAAAAAQAFTTSAPAGTRSHTNGSTRAAACMDPLAASEQAACRTTAGVGDCAPKATLEPAPRCTGNVAADGGGLQAAPCPYPAAVCGLGALLSAAALRGHADIAARWCVHALCSPQQSAAAGAAAAAAADDGLGISAARGLACASACPETAESTLAAALAGVSDTCAHERLWHALLLHAAPADTPPGPRRGAGAGVRHSGASSRVLRVLGVLWRDGTARALPSAQHVTLLQGLQLRRGAPLPPPSQLLLVRLCLTTSNHDAASPEEGVGRSEAVRPQVVEGMALSGTMAAPDTPLPAFTAAAFSGACGTSARSTDLLQRLAETAAATWAAASGALGVAEPPPAQAALTFLLLLLLAAVGNDGVDRSGSLLRSILKVPHCPLLRALQPR